jgi:hypothetical protein
MKTIEEFKYEINQVENILLTIILLREDYKFFFNQSNELIESVFVPYRKISRIKLATLRYLNLEILILLDKREAHSLKKFINKMINNYSLSEWRSKISLDELKELNNEIDDITESETFQKMKILRDKHLAHKDLDRDHYSIEWTPYEIIDLTKRCEIIINKLKSRIINTQTFFEFDNISIGNYMFKDLLRLKQLEKAIFEAYKDPNSYFKTETLFHWINRNKELTWESESST